MRILYGVAGEGNGHATRSKTVIEHLQRSGHTILVAGSKQAYRFLSPKFPTIQIRGLQIKYQDGGMDLPGSIALNLAAAPRMLNANLAAAASIDGFAPQVVITDLEPFAYYYAKARGLPVISIDNHQAMPRCEHPPEVITTNPAGFRLVSTFVSTLMPKCDHYVVSTFARAPVSLIFQKNTTLVPPILREDILLASRALQPNIPPPVLVYQTDKGGAAQMFNTLHAVPQHFIVYGTKAPGSAPLRVLRSEPLRRDLFTTEIRGNCTIKSFNEREFVQDLAASHAVVSNGGYSFLSEAVALQKPVFSVPMKHHAEQIFNASCIQSLGYGVNAPVFNAASLIAFLRETPRFAAQLRARPQHDNNARLYATLNHLLGPALRRDLQSF